ncbi:TetR/AcrR family transcriptional regulator [Lentilitoribacter sp. Alg239-R112]|jgi:AcrR family transcriptional regulator|uniref:TetR/AcrR family transcriptional regulator n=1 Tax=Lentilitoribacter sp. Alg239-R112 TaxID=2305987 RepID=UPI0013A6FEAB|nr:TetR/AcrR family transcriptional regulator [Lentilitoribacter sp. Alg239-R112]
MRKELQKERRAEIEKAAYELIDEKGFLNVSMLSIAKRAKASNETLYRWYGDKIGLFKALVSQNAVHIKQQLEDDLKVQGAPFEAIKKISPLLLELLTSERAIALNRAAAADASGVLGAALSEAGRQDILPIIALLFERVQDDGLFPGFAMDELCSLYMKLLVGDLQIRRLIGAHEVLSQKQIHDQASQALQYLMLLSNSKIVDE